MPPYQFGNPMNDFYIRQAQQLAQNQPQFPHPAPQAKSQIVASIVTNIDEAKATKVDPFTACVFNGTSKSLGQTPLQLISRARRPPHPG